MRALLLSVLALACLGWLASVVDLSGRPAGNVLQLAEGSTGTWRRTANGWENMTEWNLRVRCQPLKASRPGLHPLGVAAVQFVLSLTAFFFFPAQHRRNLQSPERLNLKSRDFSGVPDQGPAAEGW